MELLNLIHSKIGKKLLLKIFSWYFFLAVLVTFIQISLEFNFVRNSVLEELKTMRISFGPSISKSVWSFDKDSLSSNLEGVLNSKIATGIKIEDLNGKIIGELGKVTKVTDPSKLEFSEKQFSYSSFLTFREDGGVKDRLIGKATFYSSNYVIIDRVKYGLFLIIINSIVKSMFLWIIMLYFIKNEFADLLSGITEQIKSNESKIPQKLSIKDQSENELSIFVSAFNRMVEEIGHHSETLEDRIKERTKELEIANQQKEKFLARMSHEIRTPLNGISGGLTLLEEKLKIDKDVKDLFDMIRYSSDRLMNTVSDILDFSKIKANEVKKNQITFNLKEVCENAINTVKSYPIDNGNKFNLKIDERTPVWIKSDQDFLYRILNNLFSNSNKFTVNGKIDLIVSFSNLEGNLVLLNFKIVDTGIGIDSEFLKNIFNPFSQEDDSLTRSFEGTGLGMPIVHDLIEALGGKIEIESEKMKGTKVEFSIRAEINQPKPLNSTEVNNLELDQKKVSLGQHLALKIMIVDDDFISLKVGSRLLNSIGYNPIEAKNGEEAVKFYDKFRPDLVFMDIRMPGISGLEATTRILKLELIKGPLIIAVTADTTVENKTLCRKVGMKDFISKPYTLIKLKEMILKYGKKNS